MRMRLHVPIACLALAIAACAPPTRTPAPQPPDAVASAPEPTRARFSVEATSNDTWNAVGQILVRTPHIAYEGRAQMLGLYSIRHRGAPLRILTRALPLSDGIVRTTTEVAVIATNEAPVASAAVVDLMVLLQRELPAEIASVKAKLAAAKKAQEAKAKARKKKAGK